MKKRICVILQARITSTIFAAKVLMEICNKPIIYHIIERLKHSKRLMMSFWQYPIRSQYMLADDLFPLSDVTQDFQPKIYSQIGSPNDFIPYLSVLDALMNVGPDQTADLVAKGTTKWLTWEEMAAGKKELPKELRKEKDVS